VEILKMRMLKIKILKMRMLSCVNSVLLGVCTWAMLAQPARSESVQPRHPQGWAHGFVEILTTDGQRIGIGDLVQRTGKGQVTSRLILNFFDGSVDDETTVYTQQQTLRLLSDHHVQHGPSFPKPTDVLIDVTHGLVRAKDENGKMIATHIEMPGDTYNGMASTILMNLPAGTSESSIAIVIGGSKPKIAHLKSTIAGTKPYTLGGVRREATEWTVHVDLGGVAKVVAPIIGKEPPDYHVLIGGGEDPVFLREDGPLYEGGPIWRVQQLSAIFPQ
jgi:hypothetical protein